MSKYQVYPEYKNSGVEWLGKIPKSWQFLKLKYVAFLEGNKVEPSHTLNYVGLENVQSGNGKYVTTDGEKPEGLSTSFTGGDVLFGKLRPYLAKSWLADFDGICSSEFLVLRSQRVTPKFLNYYTLTEEFINQVNSTTYGSKMPRANWEFISLMGTPVPSYYLSDKIANFIDHETAKIDTLIEKQQQLIKLLKEKRQAVISHAVTKGLNPDAPMKDSGVEWLGEVPEHWKSAKLKYLTDAIVDGAHFTPTYVEEGIPFLRVTDIQSEEIDLGRIKFIPKNEHEVLIQRCKPAKGDLLLSKNGTIGIPKIIDWDWEFSIFVSLCLIKFNHKLNSEYAYFNFMTHQIHEQVFGLIKQSTVINLHLDKIQNFYFSVPPIEEQERIVENLRERLKTFDGLISKANKSIRLSEERRTALISAAVTGKIDVRNWKPEQSQPSMEAIA